MKALPGLGLLLAGLAAWSVGGAPGEFEPALREAIHAVYRLYYEGIPMGEVNETWVRNGAAYRIESKAVPYPVVRWIAPSFEETSMGTVTEGYLRPVRFEHRRSDEQGPHVADFHWETNELVEHFDGRNKTVALPPHTQDMLSIKYLYRVAGTAPLDRDLPMTTGKRLEIHHFVLLDEGPLRSEAGSFITAHWGDRGQQAPSRFEMWLASDGRYPPIRMRVTERGHEWEQRLMRVDLQ